jgi:hypothetical protein
MPRGKELYNVNCLYIDSKGVQCIKGFRPNEYNMCSLHRPKNISIPYKPCARCGLPSRRVDMCIRPGCGWDSYQANYNKATRLKNKLKKQADLLSVVNI